MPYTQSSQRGSRYKKRLINFNKNLDEVLKELTVLKNCLEKESSMKLCQCCIPFRESKVKTLTEEESADLALIQITVSNFKDVCVALKKWQEPVSAYLKVHSTSRQLLIDRNDAKRSTVSYSVVQDLHARINITEKWDNSILYYSPVRNEIMLDEILREFESCFEVVVNDSSSILGIRLYAMLQRSQEKVNVFLMCTPNIKESVEELEDELCKKYHIARCKDVLNVVVLHPESGKYDGSVPIRKKDVSIVVINGKSNRFGKEEKQFISAVKTTMKERPR